MELEEKVKFIREKLNIPKYFNKVILEEQSDYYSGHLVDFEIKPTCCCPVHNEDTASFRYYPDTDTYFCFGCGSGGDVIRLHFEYMNKTVGEEITPARAIDQLINLINSDINDYIGKIDKKIVLKLLNDDKVILLMRIKLTKLFQHIKDVKGRVPEKNTVDALQLIWDVTELIQSQQIEGMHAIKELEKSVIKLMKA